MIKLSDLCDIALQDSLTKIEEPDVWVYDEAKFIKELATRGYKLVPILEGEEN